MPHRLLRVGLVKEGAPENAQAILAACTGISAVRPQEGLGRAEWLSLEADFNGDDKALQTLLAEMIQRGLPVVQFSEDTKNLEEVFMRTTRGIVS
jgi:hypothetical protein